MCISHTRDIMIFMGPAYDLLPATTVRRINKRDESNAAEQDGVGPLTQKTLTSTSLINVNSVKGL